MKPVLRPTGEDSYVIAYLPAADGDDFDFAAELAVRGGRRTNAISREPAIRGCMRSSGWWI